MAAKPHRYTIRSSSSALGFWLGAAVLVVLVGAPLVMAEWRVVGFVLPPALLLGWALWLFLYRPAVHYDEREIVVVNVGRVHTVPWSRVVRIRQRFSLELDFASGRPLQAWGVQPPRRAGNVASMFDRRSRTPPDPDRYVHVLEGFRENAEPGDAPVTRRWDVVPLAIGAVLIAAVIVEIAIGV
ncbi:PH domain-containing protein [Pseudolysinimonas sp.]|uniref:PH domain-containing protein n=1 Tax=Pseudolysinimonas sp. TaxID=2680009 RepID=UPI003F7D1116